MINSIDGSFWEEIDELPTKLEKNIYFVDNKFKAPILAGDIIYQDYSFNPDDTVHINRGWLVLSDNKKILRYNGRFYKDDGDTIIKNIVQRVLGSRTTKARKDEVISWVKDNYDLYVERTLFNKTICKIGVENGVLDINSMEFNQHSPDDYLTSILPVTYDPGATCPRWESFLQDVCYMEDILFLQEYVGYCLYRNYQFAILVLLVGSGRNGKSTFIRTVTEMLGQKNVSQIPLQQLAHSEYGRASLYNKWANLNADIGSQEIKSTGVLKMLTGGDYVYARNIYEPPFSFINYAKLLFACNELPTCKDTTVAMMERWAVIEFSNVFKRGTPECDPDLFDKLKIEIPGIFNWAVQGLKRLLENKTFSPYRDLEDVSKYLVENKNPVKIFCDTHIREKKDNVISKEMVYKAYLRFTEETKHPKMHSNHFSAQLKMFAPYGMTEAVPRTLTNKRQKSWVNIELVNEKWIGVNDEVDAGKNEVLQMQQEDQQESSIYTTGVSGNYGND